MVRYRPDQDLVGGFWGLSSVLTLISKISLPQPWY